MITQEEYMEIQILYRQGKSIRQISKELGVCRNTVRKFLREERLPCYSERNPIFSKLDPYKSYLLERVEKAKPHKIPATVLLKEIKEFGFQGEITIIRDFIRKSCKQGAEEEIIRFETPVGKQAQADWTTIHKGLYAFAMILGYSRMGYIEFVGKTDLEHLIQCHENAFEYFGGVCEEILYDNMKTVVIQRDRYGSGKHGFQQTFWDFAKHWGFIPRLCRPYRAKTKGKVERFIGYIKHSFYFPLATKQSEIDLYSLNIEVKKWLSQTAAKRHLREKQTTPENLFVIEKAHLQPCAPSYVNKKKACLWNINFVTPHNLELYEKVGGAI